ncbi:MAG: hydrogenase iron-sulfur subunit [Thermodesulfobacteriota bacterium]|jgi:coenzyme F420-reducing hydrogenase delta subunit
MTADRQISTGHVPPATSPGFQPELTAFTCSYCAYMSGDTAGALRLQYPATVKVVKLPCTGKADARYLLAAFEEGADGVYVIACPIGNCHHVRGNERARARVERTRKLLEQVGLEGERLGIFFLSGGMGESFAAAAREMTERIRRLGPSPLRSGRGLDGITG